MRKLDKYGQTRSAISMSQHIPHRLSCIPAHPAVTRNSAASVPRITYRRDILNKGDEKGSELFPCEVSQNKRDLGKQFRVLSRNLRQR